MLIRLGYSRSDTPETVTPVPSALARCVGNVTVFREELWGRRSRFLPPADPPDVRADLLTLADVDTLITGTALRVPMYRLVRGGKAIPEREHTRSASIGGVRIDGIADAPAVLEALDDGATLVLQGLQRYWPALTRFVRELEVELGHPCQVNAYITPPGAQGLAVHSDEHDVLVLQVHGSKAWEIFPAPGEPEGPPRSLVLEPGSCLYLPEGTPHAARAQEQMSVHLTIGILTMTWRAVLESALNRLPSASLDERLPLSFADDPGLGRLVAERLRRWGRELAGVDAGAVAGDLAEDFATSATRPLGGGLLDRAALDSVTDTTLLRRRSGAVAVVRPPADGDDRLRLLLGDRELRLPARTAPAVAIVAARTAFTAGDLSPHLGPSSRLVLVRRLIREGLLEIAQRPAPAPVGPGHGT